MVPKCRVCVHMAKIEYPTIAYRRCDHKDIGDRYIRGNEHKTSPKWCPLRNK